MDPLKEKLESKQENLQRETLAPVTSAMHMTILEKLPHPYLLYRLSGLSKQVREEVQVDTFTEYVFAWVRSSNRQKNFACFWAMQLFAYSWRLPAYN